MSTTSFSNDSRRAKAFADTGAYKVGTLFVKTLGFAILAFAVIFAYRALDDFPGSLLAEGRPTSLIEGTVVDIFLLGIALGYALASMQSRLIKLAKALYYRVRLLRISISQPVAEWLDNAGTEIEGLPLNDVLGKIQPDLRLTTLKVRDLWEIIQLHPRWETRLVDELGYVAIFLALSTDDEFMSLHPACSRIGIWFAKALGLLVLLYLLLFTYRESLSLSHQSLLNGAGIEEKAGTTVVIWGGLLLGAIISPTLTFANNLSRAIYHALRTHWPTS